jgi:hypothetical protein
MSLLDEKSISAFLSGFEKGAYGSFAHPFQGYLSQGNPGIAGVWIPEVFPLLSSFESK